MGDDFEDFDNFDRAVAPGEQDDFIPCRGEHRGVPLHADRSPARIRQVKGDIDKAFELSDVTELYAFAGDVVKAPEARLFAAAKLEALWNDATERRRERPPFDRERLKAMVVGLDSKKLRDMTHFGTLLDVRARYGVPRERRLGPDD